MIEKYLVKKITEPVDWKVTVPGSKSMTNRALLMAVLSAGTVRVEGVLFSDDSRHFLACLVALGFTVEIEEEKKCFNTSTTPIIITRLVVLIIRVTRLIDSGIRRRRVCGIIM